MRIQELHDPRGRLTKYGFSLGHTETFRKNDENVVILSMSNGVFHIKGFVAGKDFWHSMYRLKEARLCFNKQKKLIKQNTTIIIPQKEHSR